MSCSEIAALLATGALFPGAGDGDEPPLPPEEAAALTAHLAGCPACREVEVALARAGTHIAETSQERARMEPLTPDLRERTLAAVQEVLALEAPAPALEKAPAAPEPGPDPARIEAVGKQIALACSYCHDRAGREDVVFCASCLAPHHRECFASHGRCSLPGCGETRTVRPADAPAPAAPPPRRGRLIGLLLTPLVAGGVAAVTQLARREPAGETQEQALPSLGLHERPKGERGPDPRSARCDVNSDGSLAEALAAIGSSSGLNVLLDPAVDEPVSVSLREIPAGEAVDVLARMTGCEVEELPGGVLYVSQPPKVTIQFTDANVRTVLQLLAAYSGKNVVMSPDVTGSVSLDVKELHWARALETLARTRGFHVTPLHADAVLVTGAPLDPRLAARLPIARPVADPGPLVDLQVADVDLAEVCEALSRQAGVNVLVDPAVEERVSATLRRLPLRHALGALARLTGCRVEERRGGVLLLTQPPRSTIQANDCPASLWYQLLAAAGGFGVAIDQEVSGPITVDLKEIDYRVAAELTAAAQGCTVDEQHGMLSVTAIPGLHQRSPLAQRAPADAAPLTTQLAALLGEQERLARAARETTDEQERAALTAQLVERQAELRALIAPRATAEEPTVAAPDPAQVEAALTRIAALKGLPMEQIVERIREPELVQDMQLVLEAQDALRQQPDSPQATRDLGALTYRLSDLGDLTHALELQVRITQGNERLRAMSEAVRAERWDALRREGARVDRLVETMRGHEREVFHRNAEALRERAAALLEKGQRLEQLGTRASALRVQAVLTGEGTSLAVISGRVYAEGAEILDEDGREQEPPLRVVRVSRSVVTLDLGGTEFVRELGQ